MESILANRIRDFYYDTGFLCKTQHGFRRNEGVDELLLLLRLRWAKLVLKKHTNSNPSQKATFTNSNPSKKATFTNNEEEKWAEFPHHIDESSFLLQQSSDEEKTFPPPLNSAATSSRVTQLKQTPRKKAKKKKTNRKQKGKAKSKKKKQPREPGPAIHAIFLDIKKAFDRVWHTGLIWKLHESGITGQLLHWIKNFLKSRKQTVVVEGRESTPLSIHAGVPQGSILGPLLFLVYINDLDPEIKSQHFFFADDTQMFQANKNETEQVYQLNKDLKAILKWSKKWMVQFAPKKTIYLRISRMKPPSEANYQTYGTTSKIRFDKEHIKRSTSHRVLGVIFQDNLRFNEHSQKVITNLTKRLFLLKRFIYYNSKLSIKIKLVLAFSFILSQLRSFILIWKPHQNHDKIRTLYHDTMKIVLGARKNTPIAILYSLTEWLTIKDIIFLQYFKILSKIPFLRNDHLLAQETNLDEILENVNANTHPTLYHKQISQQYHQYPIEDAKLKINHKFTKDYLQYLIKQTHLFTKIPEEIQKQQLKDPQKGTTILRFNKFATSPYYEKAIKKLFRLPGHISKDILQLFTGWSWLNNTGKRYQILENADCPVCKTKETVKHFLAECVAFAEHRETLKHNLRSIPHPLNEATLFGLRNLSSKQLRSIFLSLYDYVSHTKRKKIGYNQNLETWKNMQSLKQNLQYFKTKAIKENIRHRKSGRSGNLIYITAN